MKTLIVIAILILAGCSTSPKAVQIEGSAEQVHKLEFEGVLRDGVIERAFTSLEDRA